MSNFNNNEQAAVATSYLSFDDYQGECVVKYLSDEEGNELVIYEQADDIVISL